jgi:hypothetical protein
MAIKKVTKIESAAIWQVVDLRLTAFPEQPIDTRGELNWWQNTLGESPESKTVHPKSGQFREEGPFENEVLALKIDQLRIDWTLTRPQDEIPVEELPTIGGFSIVTEKFTKLMRKWLESDCPELDRIAFGAVLMLPVQNRKAGYELLVDHLPNVTIDPENSQDFMYRINRPRSSALNIPGLLINRLCTWSVSRIVNAMMKIEPTRHGSERRIIQEFYGCRLQLDINTSENFEGPLPPHHIVDILDELVSLGTEIALRGDLS